ncbi:MAG: carbamoyl-phosphate synthase small subunit, partial [Actinobacteria bacterium]|nr:carbamoyl-phosphate synthase small subunit [Actinomycetota bacterium]
MSRANPPAAVLVLEDGYTAHGDAYGALGRTFGEAVFNTGMTGYQETLTDPSYHRQVVVMTAPHIGNTGVNDEDPESRQIWVAGYVVRDPSRITSSWRAQSDLHTDLAKQGVVGISGIDTRALTRHLRERGAMRVGIFSGDDATLSPAEMLEQVRSSAQMVGASLAEQVTVESAYVVPAVGSRIASVAAIDLGIKAMTPRLLAQQGFDVHVLPATTTANEIFSGGYDALFLSNGPGDPATATEAVALVQAALERKMPLFGICFGNQILGRALGFDTYKLKYGHRGINIPVKDLATGTIAISAHNHGFAVAAPVGEIIGTDYGRVEVSHVCVNDGVVEGLRCLDAPAFSVQYHPEAAAGPHDAANLFT